MAKRRKNDRELRVGCAIEISHYLPVSNLNLEDYLDPSPDMASRIQEEQDKSAQAQIIMFYLSEAQAQRIVNRIWPGEYLLGSTCGKSFHFNTSAQIAVVNDVLHGSLIIKFSLSRACILHTWPILD